MNSYDILALKDSWVNIFTFTKVLDSKFHGTIAHDFKFAAFSPISFVNRAM